MLDHLVADIFTEFIHVLIGVFMLASIAFTSNLLLGWICAPSFTTYCARCRSYSPGSEGPEMPSLRVRIVFSVSGTDLTRGTDRCVAPILVARAIFFVTGCHSNLTERRRCSRGQTLTIFAYDLGHWHLL